MQPIARNDCFSSGENAICIILARTKINAPATATMKPVFAKIPENLQHQILAVRTTNLPNFATEFHFHKECQISYIIESEGKRMVGDNIEAFESGELTLLGSDIPHVWHNDRKYFEQCGANYRARSVALFFNPDKLLEVLSFFGPVRKLEAVLKTARRGMKFYGHTRSALKALLFEIAAQDGLARLGTLLKMIELLSSTHEYELLASSGYINTFQVRDTERINKVYKYVFSHFNNEIQLDEIAAIANMNKQAFCRYFKTHTQKTFIRFLNEVRVGHACKLMTSGETRIAGLAYDCGFNSLSNFNRFFKEIKGMTPRDYLRMIAI